MSTTDIRSAASSTLGIPATVGAAAAVPSHDPTSELIFPPTSAAGNLAWISVALVCSVVIDPDVASPVWISVTADAASALASSASVANLAAVIAALAIAPAVTVPAPIDDTSTLGIPATVGAAAAVPSHDPTSELIFPPTSAAGNLA